MHFLEEGMKEVVIYIELKMAYTSHDSRPHKTIQGSAQKNAIILSLSLSQHLH